MAKKKIKTPEFKQFGIHEVHRFSARGIHHVISAMEQCIKDKIPVLDEAWKWVIDGFKTNQRAMKLAWEHRPHLCRHAGIPIPA